MAFDFAAVAAPFRMQPGLRRLAAGATQLSPNSPASQALREKLAVLRSHADEALVAQPGFDAGPALAALLAHAAREHPGALAWDGAGRVTAFQLGWSLHGDELRGDGSAEIGACLAALPSQWRLAGLLSLAFAEDFAIIDGRTSCIPWLAVCLPSHWAPQDKVGRHFAQVHAPVADNQLLVTAGEHLARLVTGTDHWERFVWTIAREPGLDMHPRRCENAPWRADLDASALAAGAYFRTERQTFIPLAAQQQAVFTIHVDSRPLAEAIVTATHAGAVHDALASMSPAVLDYRGLTDARDRLLDWLAARR
jgi:dimethylamine monooxygenase subunit A